MIRLLLPPLFVASLAASGAGTVHGQTDFTLEIGASQVGPPVGTDAQSSHFGVGGLRLSHYSLSGSGVAASLLFGRTFGDPEGGDFVSGAVGTTFQGTWGSRFTGGLDVRLLGFGIGAPFPYRALAAEGGPTLEYRTGPVSIRSTFLAGFGRSRSELMPFPNRPRTLVFEDDLWRLGGTMEVMVGRGPVRAGVAGGLHDTPGGGYASGGGRIVFAGSWGAAELRADVWDTPLGTEATGGLVFVIPLAGWSLRGFLGRSEPDPLTLAQPGSGSGGVLVGRSLYSRLPADDLGSAPYQVLTRSPQGARVRMSVDAPTGAHRVELLGDFTLWDALPMERSGSGWAVEVDIENGTHHYGFLVDGEWYLPDDTQNVVPDEWGRMSAVLVIEGVE